MRLCDYCQAGMAVLPTMEIGKYIFCNAECAEARLSQIEGHLAKMTKLVRSFHYFCENRTDECNDSESECPIAMGEWVEEEERMQLAQAEAALAIASNE